MIDNHPYKTPSNFHHKVLDSHLYKYRYIPYNHLYNLIDNYPNHTPSVLFLLR